MARAVADEKDLHFWGHFRFVRYRLAGVLLAENHLVEGLVVVDLVVVGFVAVRRLRGEADQDEGPVVVFFFSAQLYRVI